ncbi:MAG: SprB repeat-containing protein [Flavobacteriales bacterium]|nr:SprB repeat-containing protein [Flavobacteriales bacterium]
MRSFMACACLVGSFHSNGAINVYLQVFNANCLGDNGAVLATAINGVAPYTYMWNTGATDPDIYGLAPGIYSVTVTDNVGTVATADVEVSSIGAPASGSQLASDIFFEGLEPCVGACNGGFRMWLPNVSGGYSVSTTPSLTINELVGFGQNELDVYITYEVLGACVGQSIDVNVTNACGGGSTTITIPAEIQEPTVNISTNTGSCTGADDGYISGMVELPMFYIQGWSMEALDDQGATVDPEPSNSFNQTTEPFTLSGLHPGDWVMRFTSGEAYGSMQARCIVDIPFTIADLGSDCAALSGTVHFETDEDCVQDGLEVGMPNQLLRVTPGPLYGITASDGTYSIALPYGSYDLEQLNTDAVQLCPGTIPIPITVSSGINVVVDLADSLLTPLDIRAYLYGGTMRVGYPFRYSVRATNTTGRPGENVTITLDHDPLFPLISASSGANTSVPGQVTWSIPVLGPFQTRLLSVDLQVPADPGLLGTVHSATANVTSTSPEPNTANNAYTITRTVVSSYDPNDKQGISNVSGSSTQFFLDQDQWVDYVVRFQNTGTDTAFTVVIRDELEADLDIESLEILGASHPYTPSFGDARELVFTFSDILLPDSTTDLIGSQGFVAFRLKPRTGLLPGDALENTAAIFFDFNEPVITEPSVLVAELNTGLQTRERGGLVLSPVPTCEVLGVTCPTGMTSLRIIGADGREVTRSQERGTRFELNVSALEPGTYILVAALANGSEARERFIKQ